MLPRYRSFGESQVATALHRDTRVTAGRHRAESAQAHRPTSPRSVCTPPYLQPSEELGITNREEARLLGVSAGLPGENRVRRDSLPHAGLSDVGHIQDAYRLLLQGRVSASLFPVCLGADTGASGSCSPGRSGAKDLNVGPLLHAAVAAGLSTRAQVHRFP